MLGERSWQEVEGALCGVVRGGRGCSVQGTSRGGAEHREPTKAGSQPGSQPLRHSRAGWRAGNSPASWATSEIGNFPGHKYRQRVDARRFVCRRRSHLRPQIPLRIIISSIHHLAFARRTAVLAPVDNTFLLPCMRLAWRCRRISSSVAIGLHRGSEFLV